MLTELEMARAGALADNFEFTDKQLELVIKATKLTLAYISNRKGFDLATSPLQRSLEMYENMMKCGLHIVVLCSRSIQYKNL